MYTIAQYMYRYRIQSIKRKTNTTICATSSVKLKKARPRQTSLRGFEPNGRTLALAAAMQVRTRTHIHTRTKAECHVDRPLARGDRRRLVHWLHFPSQCVNACTCSHGAVADGSLACARARERPRRSYACIGYARIAACVRLLTHIRQGARTPRWYDSYTRPSESACVCDANVRHMRTSHRSSVEMRFALTCAIQYRANVPAHTLARAID